jgi:hypothetical protein
MPVHSTNSQIISMDGMLVLKIENTNDYLRNHPDSTCITLTFTNAAIIKKNPVIICELKAEHPSDFPHGRLELNLKCYFPPLAAGGDEVIRYYPAFDPGIPMEFNWTRSELKVNRNPVFGSPTKFELQLCFQGAGTVYVRPLKLLEPAKTFSSWWSPEQGGLIGGIGGSFIGCFGGLIGWLVSKGKARKFVLTTTTAAIVLGFLLTIGGLVAAVLKQPYSVWYALLFPGVILILVFSLNLHSIQRRYDELEIRRMTSMDTGS